MSFWASTILILVVCCAIVGYCLVVGGSSDPRKDDYVHELDKYNMRNRGQ